MMDPNEASRIRAEGLVVDLFAGGGGASTGLEAALGRPIDVALNHDRHAVALHAMNHPRTRHICQDVWKADPAEIVAGRPTFWIHASPSCTQFSRSRRALPAERQVREMSWRVVDWVRIARPIVLTLENVGEMVRWGPLDERGFPIPERRGETWDAFIRALRDLGYDVEWRMLNSAAYGAPTARDRLFLVARRDGIPNRWPVATHGPGTPVPYASAGDHIDWSKPAPSIFDRPKPLADATMTRIFKGLRKFVLDSDDPYMAPAGTTVGAGRDNADAVAAFIAQNHALLPGRSLRQPASTICTKGAGQGLVTAAFMNVMRNNAVGTAMRAPANTMCASGGHFAEVRVAAEAVAAYGVGFYSQGGGQMQDLGGPIGTITTRDRFAVVLIRGVPHRLVDIGFRFLTANELWGLSGFPVGPAHRRQGYIVDPVVNGSRLSQERQKRLIGNAVVPQVAEALAAAILATMDDPRPLRMAA